MNNLLPLKSQITNDEIISVTSLHFFERLGNLLEKTPKKTLANYYLWRIVENSVQFLSKDLRDKFLEHKRRTTGQQSDEPRWRECTDLINNKLPLAPGAMYVRKYFQKDSKKEALDMVTNIRDEFKETLSKVEWMDKKTREEALKKLKAMDTLIGYPDELMDDSKLEEWYKGLNITDSTFLENILEIQKYSTDFEFGRLREPFNKTDWIDHARPADVNAYYSGIENNIRKLNIGIYDNKCFTVVYFYSEFPAGILQGVFFTVGRPKYMNYGAMGLVIGHEITHGYDDTVCIFIITQ